MFEITESAGEQKKRFVNLDDWQSGTTYHFVVTDAYLDEAVNDDYSSDYHVKVNVKLLDSELEGLSTKMIYWSVWAADAPDWNDANQAIPNEAELKARPLNQGNSHPHCMRALKSILGEEIEGMSMPEVLKTAPDATFQAKCVTTPKKNGKGVYVNWWDISRTNAPLSTDTSKIPF